LQKEVGRTIIGCPIKDRPIGARPTMSTVAFQLPLRQQLPLVQGNADYQVLRQTLQRISELIECSGMDGTVLRFCRKRAKRGAREKARGQGRRFAGLSDRQERWLQKAARQAVRCTVARSVLKEPYRDFSSRLADSGLLQQFCLLDTLEPIRVPSKSTLERLEKMVPEGLVRELVCGLLMQAGSTSKAQGPLGLREPIDMETFFLDTTCLKANIHFPVDWVLLRDATRTLMKAVTLIRRHGLRHRMAPPAQFITAMNRLCIEMTHARKREDGARRRKKILRLMKALVGKVRRHAQNHRRLLVERRAETSLTEKEGAQILRRLEGVLDKLPAALRQAHERIIGGRAVGNAEKILSLYEPEVKVIIRGKAGASVEFGNTLLIAEQREGLIVDWRLYREQAPAEAAVLVESLERVAERHKGLRPASVVTDRGFDAPESRDYLSGHGIRDLMCPRSPRLLKQRARAQWFRREQRRRGQTEGRIGILKNDFLGERLRKKGYEYRALCVAWAVLAHNLWVLARLPRAADEQERIAS
jgi:hypothetical protein